MPDTPNLIDSEKYPCSKCGSVYCITNCDKFWKWLHTPEDVEIVKHAAWKVELGEVSCSNCGAAPGDATWLNGKYRYPDYCHGCGSRMNIMLEKEL